MTKRTTEQVIRDELAEAERRVEATKVRVVDAADDSKEADRRLAEWETELDLRKAARDRAAAALAAYLGEEAGVVAALAAGISE